ncbi:MAG TPA: phosphatidate cytidylyltransferase [Chitinophagaceae bacterium]|nr:phosphatidate cytidylyltransferase [Chitinophagaceae bacterium]
MRQNALIYGSLLLIISLLSSCEIIGDIFQAGIWVGVIIVVVIIAVVIWLVGRFRK